MIWEKFYPMWTAMIGRIDKEQLGEWKRFTDSAGSDAALTSAVEELAEWYGNNRERDCRAALPNLWQLKKSYRNFLAQRAQQFRERPCAFCENSRTVIVLDNGKYLTSEFPPDPANFTGIRKCGSVPCPVCRAKEYAMPDMCERVKRFCRTVSRRNELLSDPAKNAGN